MNTNANQNPEPTPEQALNVLIQVTGHPSLTLCRGDHETVQKALLVFKGLVDNLKQPESAPELTVLPPSTTV